LDRKREDRASAGLTLNVDLSTHCVNDLLADAKSKTCAARSSVGASIGLLKRLKQSRKHRWGHANACIRDAYRHRVQLGSIYQHGTHGRISDVQTNNSVVRELDSV
jgi:hypothetical protein